MSKKTVFFVISQKRSYLTKRWSFLDSACQNYPRKVVVYPATKWLLTSVMKEYTLVS